MVPTQPPTDPGEEPRNPEPTPEERALRAIRNTSAGADPGAEALALSNDFTDRWTQRLRGVWRRLRSRGRGPRA